MYKSNFSFLGGQLSFGRNNMLHLVQKEVEACIEVMIVYE